VELDLEHSNVGGLVRGWSLWHVDASAVRPAILAAIELTRSSQGRRCVTICRMPINAYVSVNGAGRPTSCGLIRSDNSGSKRSVSCSEQRVSMH